MFVTCRIVENCVMHASHRRLEALVSRMRYVRNIATLDDLESLGEWSPTSKLWRRTWVLPVGTGIFIDWKTLIYYCIHPSTTIWSIVYKCPIHCSEVAVECKHISRCMPNQPIARSRLVHGSARSRLCWLDVQLNWWKT
eukprot:9255103-Pyramimonas_sp.AAC.2